MLNNMYYEALREGRFQPTITVEVLEDGSHRATYVAPNGKSFEYVDDSMTEAYRRCQDQVIEAVKQGEVSPFR